MKKLHPLPLALSLGAAALLQACSNAEATPSSVTYLGPNALVSSVNLLTGAPTTAGVDAAGKPLVNMVVEIPAGTSQKWETCTTNAAADLAAFPECTGDWKKRMVLEVKSGKRRVLQHLGYPGNYGSIPMTAGGDGDPLDIVAIGPALERGTIQAVKVIGVIRCWDLPVTSPLVVDDKVVAIVQETKTAGPDVGLDSPLYPLVNTISAGATDDLDAKAPEATTMLKAWYRNYKGVGKMDCGDLVEDAAAAMATIQAAHDAAVAKGAAYP